MSSERGRIVFVFVFFFQVMFIRRSWISSKWCLSGRVWIILHCNVHQEEDEMLCWKRFITRGLNSFAKISWSTRGWHVLSSHMSSERGRIVFFSFSFIFHVMFIRKRLNCSLFFFLLNCVHRKRLNFFPSDVYQKEVELFYTVIPIRKRMNCFAKWGTSEGDWIVLPRHLDQQEAEMSCQVICHHKEYELFFV